MGEPVPAKRSKESKKGRSVPDMNNMEYVNAQLKGKLKLLTAEMKDAVERMNSMTSELTTIRKDNLICNDRMVELEQENALLISQIEEMANERAERDAVIEEFGTALETRIIEWKEILDEKDVTIAKLKENLMYAASDRITNASPEEKSHADIEKLINDIDRRDEIIAELQTKLSEAVVEINEGSLMIEKFKSDAKPRDSSKLSSRAQREADKRMQEASKRKNTLETLLERAEKDAKLKSEQLCEALAMLNKYEDEDSSLSEALREIKDLKDQIQKKNKHIEDLVDVINRLEIENSRFQEAVVILREKLDVDDDEELPVQDLILKRQEAQEEKIEEMRRENDRVTSENIDLKFQMRKLKTALKESLKHKLNRTNGISSEGENVEELSHRSESKKDHVELRKIKENVKWIIEENEALRQGMHEILDSIHHQDGKGIVIIQSQTLENLLEALDARHVAGWYHPAMRLQGRVNYLQGSNAELRAQLQQIRKNQLLFQAEVHQRPSSVEEGECLQSETSPLNNTSSHKAESQGSLSPSRELTPKSARSSHSQNADSGMASGKAVDLDGIQQAGTPDDLDHPESPMEDEGFGRKSEEVYAMAKEMIAQESELKLALNESEQQRRVLEAQVVALRKSLANSIMPEVHNQIKERYLEASIRLRAAIEDKIEGDAQIAMQELRDELVALHKRLSELVASKSIKNTKDLEELQRRIIDLEVENQKLIKSAQIAQEEALRHRAIDSTVLAEFNELRQKVLKLEEDQEAREAVRMSLEMTNHKVIEVELREQKMILKRDLERAKEELEGMRRNISDGQISERSNELTDCREYIEIIDFLQCQYAGSTSLSSWERYEASLNKLNNDRNEVKELITKVNDQNESLQMQHETLTSRLQIVEQLKDMLEQQIGSNEVQDIIQRFTNETRQSFAESKYKMQISNLEEQLQKSKTSITNYEAKLAVIENEINKAQRAWKIQRFLDPTRQASIDESAIAGVIIKDSSKSVQKLTKAVQTESDVRSTGTQYNNVCKIIVTAPSEEKDEINEERKEVDESELKCKSQEEDNNTQSKTMNIAILQEQLSQALSLASERSLALSRCESQLAECRAKLEALTQLLDERNVKQEKEQLVMKPREPSLSSAEEALQSKIKSLESLLKQKDDTIDRFQSLLKEDRDKHSEAAARLHEEIRALRSQVVALGSTNTSARPANSECPERDLSTEGSTRNDGGTSRAEETAILREKISRLETELSISAQLSERWHRLAEDRLRHMDSTRERLEEQHRVEISSYREELNNRQDEIHELRRQLSESRRAPTTKTEVLSFMKALQIKDNRLADEIENELEEHAAVASQQLSTTYDVEESSRTHNYELEQLQSQLDNLRKQLGTSREREKSYKSEIAELQQRLSRRYMAGKAQEKKASRREMQLERKVKELEDELHETKEILERQLIVQQAKKAKTAEDLGLWEKWKKWQQTAERLKERLKEKTDECSHLQSNYEKLRGLIACMEREKWYLRGKFARSGSDSGSTATAVMPPPAAPMQAWTPEREHDAFLVEDLQRECSELRARVAELLVRLSNHDSDSSDDNKRIIFENDEYASEELRRMKDMQEILEKENLRMETENFELRLELERANVNLPRLQEKIQHLEKYVELLKSEKCSAEPAVCLAAPRREGCSQRTKGELERTVVALRKLVEKLQSENKRLQRRQEPEEHELDDGDRRDELVAARQRCGSLATELELAEKRIALLEEDRPDQAELVRQLQHKSELLHRVKQLLTKAAANEKALRQRIQQLEFKQTLSAIPECGSPQAETLS